MAAGKWGVFATAIRQGRSLRRNFGRLPPFPLRRSPPATKSGAFERFVQSRGLFMNNIIYIIGLIVVVLAILSFLGLR